MLQEWPVFDTISTTSFNREQPQHHLFQTLRSEVRNPPIKTPIPIRAPPQRLVLGPSNLPRFRVLIPLKLRRRAHANPSRESIRSWQRRDWCRRLDLCRVRGGHGDVPRCRQGVGPRLRFGGRGWGLGVRGEGCLRGALQALKLGLLFGRETRRSRCRLEEGGCKTGGRNLE